MAERRTLTQGLTDTLLTPPPERERSFVYANGASPARSQAAATTPPRAPFTTRLRDDYAKAIKRVSLERQLRGVEPNTLQDILEEAIAAWLDSNGELPGG